MSEVRTRFAPSPTGYLHLGGARTAIFSWLYARSNGGKFILRIEDTDKERSTDESIEQITSAMKWLNLDYDEGPFRQTERQEIYAEYIEKLLGEGKAYRCVCSKDDLDAKRGAMMKSGQKPKYDGSCRGESITADCGETFVVRFKTPDSGETKVHDLLRGDIIFQNQELDDIIIARGDGSPTYNFVVVIDDALMKITHVIRGDDHLANTPRQAVIYKALGFPMPKFAHVSMILGKDGGRLSKRHGAVSVLEYRDRGFLPSALLNYLVRLGWSHGDKEIFSVKELVELFNLEAVSKAAARFDEEKLTWLNSEYIKTEPEKALAPHVINILKERGVDVSESDIIPKLSMLKSRARTLLDLADGMSYFFSDSVSYDEKAAGKFLKSEKAPLLSELAKRLEGVDFSNEENIETAFKGLLEEKGLKLKELAQPIRIALTGGTVSPGLFEVMKEMGKEKSLSRIMDAVKYAQGQ